MLKNDLNILVSKGLSAYQEGDYIKALQEFEAVLQQSDQDLPILQAAAYTANRAQEWDSAATHWQAVSRNNPKRPGPIRQYISALIRGNRLAEAEMFCNESDILKEGDQAQHVSYLITIYMAQGRTDEAAKLARTEFKLNPSDETALKYAISFFERKSLGESEYWLGQISDTDAHRDAIQLLRAKIAYGKRQWSKAEAGWQWVLANHPQANQVNAPLFLARIAANSGNTQLAEDRYQIVMADRPDHEESVIFFVRAYLRDQNGKAALKLLKENGAGLEISKRINLTARAHALIDPMTALQVYTDALEIHPENFILKVGYAEFLLGLKFTEQAEHIILECLQEKPNHFLLNKLFLRLLQMKTGSFEAQLKQAEFTLDLGPADVGLLNTVGSLLVQVKGRPDAVRHYQSAVKLVPDAAVLWRNGVYHTAMDNRLDEAAAFAKQGIKALGTSTAEQLTEAAWIMMAAGEQKTALKYANKAIKKDPDLVKAHEITADLQMIEGRYAKAWRHIERIDTLAFPRRTEKIAHIGAQCIAAFRATSPKANMRPVPGLFPEKLFHAIVAKSAPDMSDDRSGIIQFTSSLGSGGAERQVAYVMQGITADPMPNDLCSLVVNSLQPQTASDFFLPEIKKTGCEIIDLDVSRVDSKIRDIMAKYPQHAEKVRQLAALPLDASRIAIPFFAELIEKRPRVVHLWQDSINIAGGMAAVAAGVPNIVLCTRSTRPVEISRYRHYLKEGYHALFKYAGKVSVVNNSKNGARDYTDWLGIDPSKITVFYNGYDFESIRAKKSKTDRQKIRKQFSIPAKAKVIGGVMRFSAEKRPDLWVKTLCAAVDRDENVHGLIVGEGPMREALMAYVEVEGLSGRIHFAGRQTPVEPWMCAMDILFLSSVTEGLPNVLIEAQSLGVPVATMNVGGAAEALDVGVSGLTLEEATPDELAQSILASLGDTKKMNAMSKDAVTFVNNRFSLKAMIKTLKESY